MSYDVSLSTHHDDEAADEGALVELTSRDRQRLSTVLRRVLALDPTATIEESRDDQGLRHFVVADSAKLPYMEVEAHSGMLSFSMGAEPASLYHSLNAVAEVFDEAGYTLFDHQLGQAIHPAAGFEEFMQQFRSQWDSEAAFTGWLSTARASSNAAAA